MGTLFPTVGWLMLSCLLLVAPQPGASWYKHSSSPRYHTVGRASGLLIGVRRSPYLWRRNLRGDIQPDPLEGDLWGTHEQEESDSSRLLYPDPEDIGKMQERSPLIVQRNLEGARERQKSVGEEMRLGGAEKNLNPNESSRRFQGKWEMERSTEDGSLQEPRPRTEVKTEQKLTRWSPWQLEMNQQEHHLDGGRRSLQNQWQVRRNTGGEMGLQEPRQLKRTTEELKIDMLDPCQADRNLERHIFTELQNRLRLYLPKEERTPCFSQQRSSRSTRNPQIPQESSRTPESFSCEDYTWDSLKMLCKANVHFWSRSLLGARKQTTEIEEPAASI